MVCFFPSFDLLFACDGLPMISKREGFWLVDACLVVRVGKVMSLLRERKLLQVVIRYSTWALCPIGQAPFGAVGNGGRLVD